MLLHFGSSNSMMVVINTDSIQNIEINLDAQKILVIWKDAERGCSTYDYVNELEICRQLT